MDSERISVGDMKVSDADSREVNQTGDAVAAQIERLRDAVEVLAQRILPVLGHDLAVPQVEELRAAQDLGAPIAARQQQFADQIEDQVDRIRSLTRRVQV